MDKEHKIASAILEAIQDGIYVINQDYVLEYMNPAMIKELGDGTGKNCYRFIHQLNEKCSWCRAKEVFDGSTIREEIYFPTVKKTYNVTGIPLKNADGTVSRLSICRDITGRKQREEKLKASEKDYENLFEHVGCGVYISSKEGKFINANKALIDMLGYESKEAFLNIDLTRDLYVQPEGRKRFQEMIERDGRVVDYEVEFRRKDGSSLSALLTSHVRLNQAGNVIGYEGITIDQTHRKLIEKELREAYTFMNKIIQSSPNAIIAADMTGNILIWNPAAEDALGYRFPEVIGKMNIRKVYPEGMAKRVMTMMRSPEHGGVGKLKAFPIVYLRKDGSVIDGSLSAAIIFDDKGKEIASVGVFVDLEERLAMERALRQTQAQLLQAEKLAAMGRLTSQIAHELNNPLYGIMNTLELLKTEIPLENRRRKILEMALSETMRLSELLRKMLSFSKPDQEERGSVDVNTLLDEILLLYQKQLSEYSIKISSSFFDGLPVINASKNQLRQVVINLISNAIDAMPNGGTLRVRTGLEGPKVKIELSDTGVGIKKEDIERIFDSFFTTKSSVKGVGLGLSVCYGIVKEHGGDIRVQSEPGEGATFILTFPEYEGA
jgi:PAS domain S-box-containing protein